MTSDDHTHDREFDLDPSSETQPLPTSDDPDVGTPDVSEPVPPAGIGEPAPPPAERPSTINARTEIPFGLIVFLIIAVLLVIFTVQNSSEDVTLSFLVWEGSYPLALIIIGVVTVTVILDEILGLFLRRRRRKRLAEKQELQRLREMNE